MLKGKRVKALAIQMRLTSKVLIKNGKFDRSLKKIGAGTKSTGNLLLPVENTLRVIAICLRAVTVPTLKIKTQRIDFPVVGKIKFVKSVSLSSIRPLSAAENKVEFVAKNIRNVRKSLDTISSAIVDLHNEMPRIRTAVESGANETKSAGDLLVESGNIMQDAGNLMVST